MQEKRLSRRAILAALAAIAPATALAAPPAAIAANPDAELLALGKELGL